MSKFAYLVVFVIAGLSLSACSILPQRTPPVPAGVGEEQTFVPPATVSTQDSSESAVPAGSAKPLTFAEVALHSSPNDCWFIVEGNVYDVTAFIAMQKHPGGAAILEGCGKDATTLFMTRPMGSGTEHSPKAQEMLQKYYLGELVSTGTQSDSSVSGEINQ